MNVYAPNDDSPIFFVKLWEVVESIESDHIIIAGDLNVCIDPHKDKKGGKLQKSKATEMVGTILEENGWIDVWRMLHPEDFQFTYMRKNPLVMTRLDYFLVPQGTYGLVEHCQINPSFLSDHNEVELTIKLENVLKGPGYWKLNTSLCVQEQYVEEMNEIIERTKRRTQFSNPENQWAMMKQKVRQYSMSYAKEKSNERKSEKILWSKKLRTANKKLAMINVTAHNAIHLIEKVNGKIDECKEKLRKMSMYEVQGAMLRSKVKWIQEAEHNTKYFFGLEKRSAKKKVMQCIKNESGVEIRESKQILELQRNFYEKLYTKNDGIQENCKNIKLNAPKKLSENEKNDLDREITLEELQSAIKSMARNKSPGSDGLPVEWYVMFWTRIKDVYYEMVKFCLLRGKLQATTREGLISLLPKAEKDTKWLKHWRPIVLLNVDFKGLAKAIATRIKGVLGGIIEKDQNGFLKGRNIAHNLRKILDAMEFAEEHQLPMVLISIDFMKAFDRVEHNSVYKAMEIFNFGVNIIGMVKVLFADVQLCTVNNGYASQKFVLTRGLLQGNPIASYLFLLIIELLAIKIRQNNKIKGLKLPDTQEEILLAQFADDLGMILEFNQTGWEETVCEFRDFESCTGMLINYEKSTVYRMGSLRQSNARFYSGKKLQWTNEPIKMLGVYVTEDKQKLIKLNIDPLMSKAQNILKMWSTRGLSLYGKIMIINSLVASLFVHKLAVISTLPKVYAKKLDDLFRGFIWNQRKSRIDLKILKGLKENGGAGLVDIVNKDKSLKLQWIAHIMSNPQMKALAYSLLENKIGDMIWQTQLSAEHVRKIFKKESFWVNVMQNWSELTWDTPTGNQETRNQILWYNSNICINKIPVCYEFMHKAGINYIKDIVKRNGEFKSVKEVEKEYHVKIPCTIYWGLIKAIPKQWKDWVKDCNEDVENESQDKLKVVVDYVKPVAALYRRLCVNIELVKEKSKKWRSVENENVMEAEELTNIIRRIPSYTICVKLRSFQYRILMNAIVTNTHLFKYKIRDNDLCSNCNAAQETTKHLFFECDKVIDIWEAVYKQIGQRITYNEMMLNVISRNPKWVQNTIVLITKYYLYKARCLGERISVVSLKNYINEYKNIEEQIALKKNKLDIHKIKWSDMKM